jgi:uncharacterized membrane protein YhiD involved in acid resistance
MAIGAGAYVDAVGSTALIVVVLVGLRPLEAALLRKRRRVRATIRVKRGVPFETVEAVIKDLGIYVFDTRTYEHHSDRTFELNLVGASNQIDVLCDQLRKLPEVVSITTD